MKFSFKMAGATTNSYVLLNRNFTLSTDVDGNIGHQSTNARRGYGFFIHGAPSSQENKRIGCEEGHEAAAEQERKHESTKTGARRQEREDRRSDVR